MESGFAEGLDTAGGMPPASRNHRVPTACDTPTPIAASPLARPVAIAAQNRCRSSRPATDGRPGDRNGGRPSLSSGRFSPIIPTSSNQVLRRRVESAQFTSTAFTGILHREKIAIIMDGRGAWRHNAFALRLWRSIRCDEVYLRAYGSVSEARASLGRYLTFYNG